MNTSELALDPPTKYVKSRIPLASDTLRLDHCEPFCYSFSLGMEVSPTSAMLTLMIRKATWIHDPGPSYTFSGNHHGFFYILKPKETLCLHVTILIGAHIFYSRGPTMSESDSTELTEHSNLHFQQGPLVTLTYVNKSATDP